MDVVWGIRRIYNIAREGVWGREGAGIAAGGGLADLCWGLFSHFFDVFLTSFFDRFGCQKGAQKGAKIDQHRAKLVPRRLLKRFFVKKKNCHEKL